MSRSPNSHQLRLRALPHFARMWREEPFREADKADWQAAANRTKNMTMVMAPPSPAD